jgi:hypothetical protein
VDIGGIQTVYALRVNDSGWTRDNAHVSSGVEDTIGNVVNSSGCGIVLGRLRDHRGFTIRRVGSYTGVIYPLNPSIWTTEDRVSFNVLTIYEAPSNNTIPTVENRGLTVTRALLRLKKPNLIPMELTLHGSAVGP